MSIYDQQQARKAAEHWYGDWDAMRNAIKAAGGAKEGEVAAEQPQLPLAFDSEPLPTPRFEEGGKTLIDRLWEECRDTNFGEYP